MTVTVTAEGEVLAEVIDPGTHEPYTLHLADGAVGGFVGGVKAEYEGLLTEIAENCFEPDVFKTEQAKALMAYVRRAYKDELEFLWTRFPDNAIWHRKDSEKWYGALLVVSKRKLGIASDEMTEIIDLRAEPSELEQFVDGKRFFPGWHMNKKNWYTVVLDGSVSIEELINRVDISHSLAE